MLCELKFCTSKENGTANTENILFKGNPLGARMTEINY